MFGAYVTITEASKKLGKARGTIWKRIYRRRVPYTKIGNVALVRFDDVK